MDSLKISNFNLSEFIHEVLERFSYLTETQGYTITRDIEDDLFTEADAEKIEQVIYNLVGNAVNYTARTRRSRSGSSARTRTQVHRVGYGPRDPRRGDQDHLGQILPLLRNAQGAPSAGRGWDFPSSKRSC